MNRYPTETKRTAPASRKGVTILAAVTLALTLTSSHARDTALDAARAVVNLPVSAAGVIWGRAHGGTCVIHADLFITCESLDSGFTDAGTTVGNVWLYDTLDGPDRYRHEARHADEWALVGPSFPALYAAEFVRTGGRQQNVFEEWAGLHDGGYLR